jgi:K+-sensing histidine kinase KdpD
LIAGGRVDIEVTDAGPGIAPGDVDRVFGKGGRGRQPKGRRLAGTGLGSCLGCRPDLAHGGEPTYESDGAARACFGFDVEVVR